jgi:hypothetical protein
MKSNRSRIEFGVVLVLLLALSLASCGKVSDKIKEQARDEQDIENEDYAAKVNDREAELTRFLRYYSGVSGTYEGFYTTKQKLKLAVQLQISPTVRPYKGTRPRRLEEVAKDFENLGFNISMSMTGAGVTGTLLSCRYSKIPADLNQGLIEAFASNSALENTNCNVSLRIYPTYNSIDRADSTSIENASSETVNKILEGEWPAARFSAVYVMSTVADRNYWLTLSKVTDSQL